MRIFNTISTLALCLPLLLQAQASVSTARDVTRPDQAPVRVLTNQVGYEDNKAKRAVILIGSPLTIPSFALIEEGTGKTVYQGKPIFSGPVDKWKHWLFWTMDFSAFTTAGTLRLRVSLPGDKASYPSFLIWKNVLEMATLSDYLYYSKRLSIPSILVHA